MSVKAKFSCQSVTHHANGKEVRMHAVYGTNGENADFAKATPSGSFIAYIDNDTPASDYFKPGKEYYLTLEEVPEQ